MLLGALLVPIAAAGGTNQAPRITDADVRLATNANGRRTVDARLRVCDDSQRGARGHLLLEERLFRGPVLWAFLRSREPIDFASSCFRYRVRFVVSTIFGGSGGRYAVTLRIADEGGRASNAVRRSWTSR